MALVSQAERRAHPRFAYDVEATVLVNGREPIRSRTVDISYSGICMESADPVESGQWVQIEIHLAMPQRSSDLSLPAKIVWSTATGGGFQIGAMFARDMNSVLLARLDVLLQFLSGELDVPGA